MDKASRLALAIAHQAGHLAAAMAVDWRLIRAEAADDGTGCTEVEPPFAESNKDNEANEEEA